ncbi:S-adenosyl-L-methionine-dependent methyltransferase [Radiomyces spectabilis]|uniref:S-adenosyl-L-methionine-dependent methyltransferase n=1 Tax=Radiomyces spectabilis TaxID=64574 RepID=UPI0022201C98|nr:S-adenosyl-L-methionine-dependent methyltransferase [Radiomyces spectabilis]KAI8374390.1 S-adenosyl-L-methionine-dependent methyltransferase [Radiomyces spectabilis]
MSLPRLPAVRDIIKLYGLSARSQLSQNFILDKNITDKIVRTTAMNAKTPLVLEVGPGPGLLTRSILDADARNVVAVEKDDRFISALKQLAESSGDRLKVLQGNMLTIPDEEILSAAKLGPANPMDSTDPIHIIGNLPFNVASPLLIQWLHKLAGRQGLFGLGDASVWMTLMFQKEVGQRLSAEVSTQHRGRLAVMTQSLCQVKTVYTVPSTVFVPQPKVDASVVQLVPKPAFHIGDTAGVYLTLENILRYFFTKRRKTVGHILNRLSKEMPRAKEAIAEAEVGLDKKARPEDISTDQFCQMAMIFHRQNIVDLPL